MAIVREILEAVHGNNNDNTLMVDSPKVMFVCLFFQFTRHLSCRRRRYCSRKAFKNMSSIHHETLFLINLRIYVYVSVSDSLSEDPTLYISLELLHHIQYHTRRLNLIAFSKERKKNTVIQNSRCHQVISESCDFSLTYDIVLLNERFKHENIYF